MKKIYFEIIFLLFIFLAVKSNAQQVDDYKYTADSLIQHLDKTGVTTGVLYERVFPLLP